MRINKCIPGGYWIIPIVIIISSCGSGSLVEKSGQWDRIAYKDYLIENVTWNVQAAKSGWTETIFCDTISGSMGWKWDFQSEEDKPDNFIVKSFPEIIFGKKPYRNYLSTSSRLPVKITEAEFRLEYDYIANAEGIYNTSTDISFTDSIIGNEENIRAKMMIWIDHMNMPFFEEEKLTETDIDGFRFKLFVDTTHIGPEGKWIFIALLPESLPLKGELNLKAYIDYFLSTDVLKPEWFLSSIELGSEISSGEGEITFKRFIVH